MTHLRQPSIDSHTFAVEPVASDVSEASTDSYQDSLQEEQETRFDPAEYLSDSLENALSSLQMSKSIVLQAQTSGILKSKEIELIELQKEATAKLLEFQETFKAGIGRLKEVSKDLKWSQTHSETLLKHVKNKYPVEFAEAKDKVLTRNIAIDELAKECQTEDNDPMIYI